MRYRTLFALRSKVSAKEDGEEKEEEQLPPPLFSLGRRNTAIKVRTSGFAAIANIGNDIIAVESLGTCSSSAAAHVSKYLRIFRGRDKQTEEKRGGEKKRERFVMGSRVFVALTVNELSAFPDSEDSDDHDSPELRCNSVSVRSTSSREMHTRRFVRSIIRVVIYDDVGGKETLSWEVSAATNQRIILDSSSLDSCIGASLFFIFFLPLFSSVLLGASSSHCNTASL